MFDHNSIFLKATYIKDPGVVISHICLFLNKEYIY